MSMMMYVYMALCFLPVLILGIVLPLAVPGFKIRYALISVLVGLLSLIPITFIQFFVFSLPIFTSGTLVSVLITAILFNGLIEEATKMSLMFLLPRKSIAFPQFFSMAILAGLSLGAFESIIYLLSGSLNIGIRMVTAVLIHTFCAGLSGIFVWTLKNKPTRVYFFVLAVLLHGVYNFFAGFSGGYRWLSIVAILLAALQCRICYMQIAHPEANE